MTARMLLCVARFAHPALTPCSQQRHALQQACMMRQAQQWKHHLCRRFVGSWPDNIAHQAPNYQVMWMQVCS